MVLERALRKPEGGVERIAVGGREAFTECRVTNSMLQRREGERMRAGLGDTATLKTRHLESSR